MNFDFGKALNPALDAINSIETMNQEALAAVDIRNKQRDRAEHAMIDAAQHTAEIKDDVRAINSRVDNISTGLENERTERVKAVGATDEKADKSNRRANLALAVSIFAAIVGLLANLDKIIANIGYLIGLLQG